MPSPFERFFSRKPAKETMTSAFLGLSSTLAPESLTTVAPRKISKLFASVETLEGDGVLVRRSIGTHHLRHFSPFLMLDHATVPSGQGFPDHPHRGQETISYILNGKLEHEDFAGNRGILQAGDLQFMTAGKGIMHSEMPLPSDDGSPNSGLQLWVDLPKELKLCEPRYRDLLAKEIPEATADKIKVKVISGVTYGVESLKELAYTPVWYLDFTVQPGGTVKQSIPEGWNAFLYIMSGDLIISSGTESSQTAQSFDFVKFEKEGDSFEATVAIESSTETRFIFVAGLPLEQDVVQFGPFVMTNRAEIMQARMDFATCSNGFERAMSWESKAEKRRKSLC